MDEGESVIAEYTALYDAAIVNDGDLANNLNNIVEYINDTIFPDLTTIGEYTVNETFLYGEAYNMLNSKSK